MQRRMFLAAAMTAFLVFAPLLFGQDDQGLHAPPASNDVIGPQLIAWSELQEPKPVSRPASPTHQAESPEDQKPVQPANTANEPAPANSATSHNVEHPQLENEKSQNVPKRK